ncbi:MAG: tRNA pseudouridine(38-40) synthase TruA [Thermomicrobiales bacterium]
MDETTEAPYDLRLTTYDSKRRLRLTLAYDGTAFYGAQVQPGRRTVGSELEAALARITGETVRVTFAGRTDRGVHATGQVAHCDLAIALPDERLWRALNGVLPGDLAVLRLATATDDFHARYGAHWREYRYQVWNSPVRQPVLARTTWHLTRPLDLAALNAAVATLLGEHDFAAFAGQGLGGGRQQERSTVRSVLRADWAALPPELPEQAGRIVELWIRANAFLPQMVRTIVGAAVEVGLGRRDSAWLAWCLRERRRANVPAPAPPQGLTLWQVGYDEMLEARNQESVTNPLTSGI